MRRRCPKGRLLFPWALSLFFSFAAMGQTAPKVTGTVLTEQGEPLTGVTVTETGTHNAVTTNSKGVFTIAVKQVPVQLTISYIGYQTRNVSGTKDFNVVLAANKASMSDVVVTGYQSQ